MNIQALKLRILSTTLILLGLSACATPISSTVDTAEGANPGAFKTFAWIPNSSTYNTSADPSGFISPVNARRIRVSIEQELERKGYVKTAKANADLALSFNLGARDRVEVRNDFNNFGYGYYGFHNRFSRLGRSSRFGFGAPYANSSTVRHITEGTLVVDVFDNKEKEAIWHGAATKRLKRGDMGRNLIDNAVETLLDQFPDSDIMADTMMRNQSTQANNSNTGT